MANPTNWTNSQVRAYEYIESAVSQGIASTAALNQYRAGGGAIRTQDWYVAFSRLSTSAQAWGDVNYLQGEDTLPESIFAASPNKYANNYVASFAASIKDKFTGKNVKIFRQIGFDTRLTKGELFQAIDDFLTQDVSQPAASVNFITELHFEKRTGR